MNTSMLATSTMKARAAARKHGMYISGWKQRRRTWLSFSGRQILPFVPLLKFQEGCDVDGTWTNYDPSTHADIW